jgi:hypothetical protein
MPWPSAHYLRLRNPFGELTSVAGGVMSVPAVSAALPSVDATLRPLAGMIVTSPGASARRVVRELIFWIGGSHDQRSDQRKKKASSGHGGGVRGDNSAPRSVLFEGRFGRMFRSLPPGDWPRESLLQLGLAMTAEPERDENDPTKPAAAFEDPNERMHDDEENAGIAAGYTYLGQFIDHDITFDPASSLMKQNDPDALVDFRTPRLDLDSLYGRGPADVPYMYVGNKFRLGRPLFANAQPSPSLDLPRFDLAIPAPSAR